MEISLKNLLMAGIGTMAYSYEKGTELIEEMVKKGQLTINEGKELNEELKKKAKAEKKETEEQGAVTADKLKEILASLNLATKKDIEDLNERINKLENK